MLDEALGRPHDGSVTWARASGQLNGAVHTASAAFDGDPATAWTTQRNTPERQWVEVNLTEEVTVDLVPLTVVADGLHSVPTEVEVSVDGTRLGRVRSSPSSTATTRTPPPRSRRCCRKKVTGSSFRFRLTGIRAVTTNDWVSDREVEAVAIAEIGLPGPKVPELPERFDTGCRTTC